MAPRRSSSSRRRCRSQQSKWGLGTPRSRPSGRAGAARRSRITILVAGGLIRRTTPRDIGLLVPPQFRRRFRGQVIVHDAEADDLAELGQSGNVRLRANRALVETDLVVTVTAAETVLHGGPAALLAATGREVIARRGSRVTAGDERLAGLAARSRGRAAARGAGPVARRLARAQRPTRCGTVRRLPVRRRGNGAEAEIERQARLPIALPSRARQRIIERVPRELTAAAVYGGTPSTAHTEALLRAIEFKGATLARPLDAIVIGIPPATPFVPARAPEPGRGRLPRARARAPPVAQTRSRSPQAARRSCSTTCYRAASRARRRRPTGRSSPTRARARDRDALRDAERAASPIERGDRRLPRGARLPSAAAVPRVERVRRDAHRLGSVLSRAAATRPSARQLGFVPVHGLGAALAMARGAARSGSALLSPPYFPLVRAASSPSLVSARGQSALRLAEVRSCAPARWSCSAAASSARHERPVSST